MQKNVLMINSIDNQGGAGIVAWRLRLALQEKGWKVPMHVGTKFSQDQSVFVIPRYLGQITLEKISGLDWHWSKNNQLLDSKMLEDVDLIHCHNLHSSFFNLSILPKLSEIKPLVWTIHDLWPITGGACGSNEVESNKTLFKLFGFIPTDPWLKKQKAKIYKNLQAHLVVPSNWMKRQLESSILSHLPITVIHNGVNTAIFSPGDKAQARKQLGLPISKKIVLFVARNGLENRYKGGEYIKALIRQNHSATFVIVGQSKPLASDLLANTIPVAYVQNEAAMARYYQAADVLVYPTLADSFSLVTAESLSCGTPAVAFDTDALPELVIDHKTGFLARKRNISDLNKLLQKAFALKKEAYTIMGQEARKHIVKHCSIENMVEKYDLLYSSLLSFSKH
jgi:glycosyltransferase involved in cell wall biosynthesis